LPSSIGGGGQEQGCSGPFHGPKTKAVRTELDLTNIDRAPTLYLEVSGRSGAGETEEVAVMHLRSEHDLPRPKALTSSIPVLRIEVAVIYRSSFLESVRASLIESYTF
jgi:hypothetical protein